MKLRAIVFIVIFLMFSAGAEALTVKMGTLAPEGSPWYNLLREMSEEWSRTSQGKVRIRIYAGGVAGDEPDMVRKMRIGQLQAAGITIVGLADIDPDMAALQIPFILTSDEELDYVMERLSGSFEKKIEEKGFKVLTWMDAGWVRLFSQKPVVVPDDLRGMTMYVWGERSPMVDAWKSKGVKALALSPTDIYTMLQAGKINAFSTTPIAALSFQWFALANNMADMKLGPLLGAMVIDGKTWRKIPGDVRAELERIARDYGKRMVAATRSYEKEAIEVMKSHGMAVTHIPEKTRTAWREYAEEAYPILLPTPALWKLYEVVKKHRKEAGKMR
jgi:TRAP-type C4-dicarboxylate transport system substrate-binding protein